MQANLGVKPDHHASRRGLFPPQHMAQSNLNFFNDSSWQNLNCPAHSSPTLPWQRHYYCYLVFVVVVQTHSALSTMCSINIRCRCRLLLSVYFNTVSANSNVVEQMVCTRTSPKLPENTSFCRNWHKSIITIPGKEIRSCAPMLSVWNGFTALIPYSVQ